MIRCFTIAASLPNWLKIIGGDNAHTAIPWQVSLFGTNESIEYESETEIPLTKLDYSCGGTILDKRTILSAAHCFKMVEDWTTSEWTWLVVAGTKFFSGEGGQVRIL